MSTAPTVPPPFIIAAYDEVNVVSTMQLQTSTGNRKPIPFMHLGSRHCSGVAHSCKLRTTPLT